MVAYNMPFLYHTFHQVWAGFQIIAHYKKSGLHIMLFQRVQDRRHIAVFITAVKG